MSKTRIQLGLWGYVHILKLAKELETSVGPLKEPSRSDRCKNQFDGQGWKLFFARSGPNKPQYWHLEIDKPEVATLIALKYDLSN